MMRFALLLILVCSCGVAGLARADNWAQFRGPNASGVAAGKDIPSEFSATENVLWKAAIPGLGNSSPIVWNDFVFVQTSSSDGKKRSLLCLDARTGNELWSRSFPAEKAHAHGKNSLASATPATDGQAVYAAIWDGKDVTLVAHNFKGDLLWKRNLGKFVSQHGPGASPIVYKDKVIFASDMDKDEQRAKKPVDRPAVLMALDKKTGEPIWQTPREAFRACYSLPLLRERPGAAPELIVTSTTAITSYNPDDGKKNWEWTWKFKGMPLRTVSSSLLVGDALFALAGDGGGDRHMVALSLAGRGKETKVAQSWENRKSFPYVPSILSREGHLYFVNDDGVAGCFEAKSGKSIWFESQDGAKFTASPVLIDDRMFAASEEGDVYVFAAHTKYELLAKNSIGERIRATPAVAGGRLFIRGQNHLFCIGAK